MKHVFTILLLCVILQSVLTSRRSLRMRMAKVAQAMKLISDAKEKKLRKLENTDESVDSEAESTSTSDSNATVSSTESVTPPDTSVQTSAPPVVYNDTSAADEKENVNATAENAPVNASKPVATKAKTTSNTKAAVQVTKFHSFKKPTTRGPGKVTFGTFIYFFGRPIVKFIVLRLRITYTRGLRNLQEATAESARTDCEIKNKDLLGLTLNSDEGANVDYDCTANATQGDVSTANFTLNTDVPMTMVNANGTTESLDFTEVNFNGDSAESASSLQDSTVIITESYYLKNALAFVDKYVLTLSGDYSNHRLLRRLELSNGDIKMNLSNSDGTTNEYDCIFNRASSPATLTCDTSGNPLKTTVGNLHLSSGNNEANQTLFIEMQNPSDNSTYVISPSAGNRYTYSKSSSGLSGGAIAGIVIACVVALAAASIAAIMLRKPSPPVDNTTIVDLKTETI